VPLFIGDGKFTGIYLPDASVSLEHQSNEVIGSAPRKIADHAQARLATPREGECRPGLATGTVISTVMEWDEIAVVGPCWLEDIGRTSG